MSRLYDVTREEVDAAWKAVRRAGGSAGYDGQTIADVEADLDNQLYKIWNRMSSGSYQAQPVLLVEIPKAKGGVRQLGIPTVTDRIAQTVVKNRLESKLEPIFHDDSYAYRPDRDAIKAVTVCRERCFKHDWLIELDIEKFFDTIDHGLMLEMLKSYTDDKTILLYARKFLSAKGITEDGEEIIRESGTSQGGVVSPLMSNLFLHVAFDAWMAQEFPSIKFERYADDIVVHCVSEKQAQYIKGRIAQRLQEFKLLLNPDKTRIVYTGTSDKHDDRGHNLPRKFTFLGYDFKPRRLKGRTVFSPGIGKGAMKRIVLQIKTGWKLQKRLSVSLEQIAQEVNPIIRGWIHYYGHHRRSDLYRLAAKIDMRLVSFLSRKHTILKSKAWKMIMKRRITQPKLFCHWHMISLKV